MLPDDPLRIGVSCSGNMLADEIRRAEHSALLYGLKFQNLTAFPFETGEIGVVIKHLVGE